MRQIKFKNFFKIALLFSIIFFTNNVVSQGPNAPEAGAFEPVDATDMVSLLTGDLSYVLPLMNVPSPEGGYPVVLSYHAGIALEQESSWVGLGWNINPGTINRSVNGYPDDWKMANSKEVFYDQGGSETSYNLDIGYGDPTVSSIGVTLSWGSNKSLSGDVSLSSNGFTLGTDGVGYSKNLPDEYGSINIGYNGSAGIAMGAKNGLGVSMGVDGKGNLSGGIKMNSNSSSVGISFSSNSISLSSRVSGVGANYSHILNKSEATGNYSTSSTYSFFGVTTPWGYVNFGKRTYSWHLDEIANSAISGGIYDKVFSEVDRVFEGRGGSEARVSHFVKWDNYELYTENVSSIDQKDLVTSYNNSFLPSTDNYYVNAQGINGDMSPVSTNNFGTSAFSYLYYLDFDDVSKNIIINDRTTLNTDKRVAFQFSNENSSFLRVLPKSFVNNFNSTSVNAINENDYISGTDTSELPNILPQNYFFSSTGEKIYYDDGKQVSYDLNSKRLKKGNFVEFFTNKQIRENTVPNFLEAKDLDRTIRNSQFVSSKFIFPDDAIGAYRITTPDGKVYHYSLPVYQFEEIKRTYNIIEDKAENLAHFDKINETPYATHWLLTAITGPDYIKNPSNPYAFPDTNNSTYSDYGYWIRFDYGKWSDGYIWKTPYGKDYEEINDNDRVLKTYEWGRKQIYYLDVIKTRTHSALFVKDLKNDAQSRQLQYQNKYHIQFPAITKVNMPKNNIMKLNKIILLKNEDAINITKNNIFSNLAVSEKTYLYDFARHVFDGNNANQLGGVPGGFYKRIFNVNIQNNVLDIGDVNSNILNKAVKIIDFTYDYSLVKDDPYSSAAGRLTLKNVLTKGKNNIAIIPPYKFEYISNIGGISNVFDINKKDDWGFVSGAPMLWSLSKVMTPTGGKIEIEYESDESSTTLPQGIKFETNNNKYQLEFIGLSDFKVSSSNNDLIDIGDSFLINFKHTYRNTDNFEQQNFITVNKSISAQVISKSGDKYVLGNYTFPSGSKEIISATLNKPILRGGGVRTSKIKVFGDNLEYTKEYNYDINGLTSGITSFRPGSKDVIEKTPYISELPMPNVFYGNVTVLGKNKKGDLISKNVYQFETFSPKQSDQIKFGNMLEINKDPIYTYARTKAEKVTIKDSKSRIGRLNNVKYFNTENQLISETRYNYKEPGEFQQSFFQQSFYSVKEVKFYNNPNLYFYLNSTTKFIFPNILESITTINGGFSNTTNITKHDFLTGQVLESSSSNSKGEEYKSQLIPAYLKYPDMGSKVDGLNNKNMLTQEAITKSFKKIGTEWKEIGIGITTWKSWDNDIWRKHKNFTWNGTTDSQGLFTNFTGEDDSFNWTSPTAIQPADWRQISEVSKYDKYSMPLEVIDINGNKAATKMGYKDTKVLVTGNAGYDELFYSGAEDLNGSNFGGGVAKGSGTVVSTFAHTGLKSLQLNSGQNGFVSSVVKGKLNKYKASVWAKYATYTATRIQVNGGTPITYNTNELVRAGDWVQLNFYFDLNSAATVQVIASGSTIYVDDFRVYPVASTMTSYVYNEWDELTFVLGSTNLATNYEYDEVGRLKQLNEEIIDYNGAGSGGFKKVKEHQYKYKLVGDIDANGDGVIDEEETYDPLAMSQSSTNGYSNVGTLTTTVNGGSGNYRYSYAKGSITTAAQVSSLSYGSETTNNTTYVGTVPCTGGTYGYNAYAVKIRVKDIVTGKTIERVAYYNKSCSSNPGNPVDPRDPRDPAPIEQQQ